MKPVKNEDRTVVMYNHGKTVEMRGRDMWAAVAVWPMKVQAHATRDTFTFSREDLDAVLSVLVRAGHRVSIVTPQTAQTEI